MTIRRQTILQKHAAILDLLRDGVTPREIHQRLGVTRGTIAGVSYRYRHEKNVSFPNPAPEASKAAEKQEPRNKANPERGRGTGRAASGRVINPKPVIARHVVVAGSQDRRSNGTAPPVPLFDLTPSGCRWVIGDARAALFCPETAINGMSYCAEHARVVFVKIDPAYRARPMKLEGWA